ncbi:ATP-binding protein [Vibrio metschnikovii]|uniref:ATP-binding protein n=1 Tax=Vibrio TaxID=662 RepID=UPI0015CF1457|nr:ATP-binding protein [Vibrio paracholerae]EKO3617037.1 ATP-binding protein [Vibrio metschnikovii]GIA57927.1 DNA biosynthesis protein [Vibrio cholerae]EKO3763974.1 ATP-binding protein [Vibrio metschnikovii]EKO3779092.1 ATP-binding protein [Vibrio metschnikovii]EKO3888165.1 ATP-binding protein [Vibrio metschnikovii]
MSQFASILKHIPAHITPKTVEEMEHIRRHCQPSVDNTASSRSVIGEVRGVGARFKQCRLENYRSHTPAQADAVTTLQRWIESVNQGLDTNLVLAGYRGAGKTHLATAVMFALSDLGLSSEIISFHDLMLEIRSTYRSSTTQSEWQILRRLTQSDVLVVDDLDKSRHSASEQQTLQTLIDKRYRNQMPTVLITPLPGQAFCSLVGEVVLTRLRHGRLVWIECVWENHYSP